MVMNPQIGGKPILKGFEMRKILQTIDINKTGSVYIGEIILGTKIYLGTTRPDPDIAINDYSIKEPDAWSMNRLLS